MAGYTRQSSFADGDTITAALFNDEYNQLVNAFNNSTGHSHDGTTAEGPVIGLIGDAGETSPNNKVLIDTTNNYIEFYVEVSSAPVQQLYIADGAIVPVTDSDIDLGTTSLRFKDTYTDTVTTTGNVTVGGNLTVTGNATISGNLTFGDADTDSINLAAEIDSDIIPNTDGTYDLGSATKEWQDLYIDGTANIDSLVADTADINAGTIDNTVIGGTTAVAGSFTTATATTGNITTVNATTVDTTNIEVTNLKAKDGTSAGSIADTTGVVTLASSVLTTTDINGGTIDGVTIGGTSAGAVTFTDLSDGTITITAFVDEDNMASNSATLVPTQQSVKAYVDAQVTAQDLDFQGDTGGALSIDLDSETLTIAGGTGIDTVGATNTLTVSIDSTVATLTGTQTLTNKTLTSPVINTGVSGTAVLDDDTFATASATTLATSESIKAYVDTTVAATNEVVEDTTPQLGGDLDLNSNDITGTGNINNTGTITTDGLTVDGTLQFVDSLSTARNILQLSSDDVLLQTGTTAGARSVIVKTEGLDRLKIDSLGDISFYEDTGTTAKLFWDASAESLGIGTTSPAESLHTSGNIRFGDTSPAEIYTNTNELRLGVDKNNDNAASDITFYVDNSEKVRIDSSGNVGIGTTSPANTLHVYNSGNIARFQGSDATLLIDNNTANSIAINSIGTGDSLTFGTNATERMRIDSSGNVGIGTSSPAHLLHLSAADPRIQLTDTTTNVDHIINANSSVGNLTIDVDANAEGSSPNLIIDIANSERMRITSSGNVGINTSSPNASYFQEIAIGTSGLGGLYISSPNNASVVDDHINITAGRGATSAYNFLNFTNSAGTMFKVQGDGNVGIGTASPATALDVSGTVTADGLTVDTTATRGVTITASDNLTTNYPLFVQNNAGTGRLELSPYGINNNLDFKIQQGGVNRIFIESSNGNVGIGTDVPSYNLVVNDSTGSAYMQILSSDAGVAGILLGDQTDNVRAALRFNNVDDSLQFWGSDFTERMRIDSSGNLLVGKTTSASSTAGTTLWAGGYLNSTVSNDYVARFNRLSTNGDIIQFQKDGTSIGSIYSSSARLQIGKDATSVVFESGLDAVVPNGTGSGSDGNTTLGWSNNRFKDLYLSGVAKVDSSAYISQGALTSSSGSVAWDAAAKANAYYATTENTTFAAPTNAVEGAIISVEIAQGGTAYTVAWNTVFEFAASTAPTVTATANKTDIFSFRYNGSVWQEIGRTQNLAQT